jgi:hypothetical protein
MPNSSLNERPDASITNTSSTLRPTILRSNKGNHSKLEFATDDQWLPPPVIAKQYGIEYQVRKQTKFNQSRLRVHWDNFTRRLGNGTAPSTSSVPDGSTVDGSHRMREPPPGLSDDEVDEVVVERVWFEEQNTPSTETESLAPIEKYGENPTGGTNTDRESLAAVEGFWAKSTLLVILRWRLWPALLGFFRLRFIDEKSEAHYSKESWFFRKTLALFCSLFFVGNWILGVSFLPRPASLPDKIFYYGVRSIHPTRRKRPLIPFPPFLFLHIGRPRLRCSVGLHGYLRFSSGPSMVLPDVSRGFNLVLVLVPNDIDVRVTVRRCLFASFSQTSNQIRHLCGFYEHDTPKLYPCGSKDFLTTF